MYYDMFPRTHFLHDLHQWTTHQHPQANFEPSEDPRSYGSTGQTKDQWRVCPPHWLAVEKMLVQWSVQMPGLILH